MARQMVAKRPGASAPAGKPGLGIMIAVGKPKGEADDNASDTANGESDGDTVKCPNCGCQFDDETGKVMKPGKPVEGGGYSDEGKELDQAKDALPVPGRMGAAHDAAAGEQALTEALASVLAGRR